MITTKYITLLVSKLLLLMTVISTPLLASSHQVSFCFNNWPPYAFKSDQAIDGISISIIKEASIRLGYQAVFYELPWKRCLQKVLDGEVDAVIDAAKRDDYLQGPTSFSIYSDTFWVRKNSGINAPDDFKWGKIGLVDGYSYNAELLDRINMLKLVPDTAVDDSTNIRKLAFGRVDSIIADLVSTLEFTKKHKLSIKPLLPPFSYDPLYTSFNNQKKSLNQAYDDEFKKLIEEGFVDQIYLQFIDTRFSNMVSAP